VAFAITYCKPKNSFFNLIHYNSDRFFITTGHPEVSPTRVLTKRIFFSSSFILTLGRFSSSAGHPARSPSRVLAKIISFSCLAWQTSESLTRVLTLNSTSFSCHTLTIIVICVHVLHIMLLCSTYFILLFYHNCSLLPMLVN